MATKVYCAQGYNLTLGNPKPLIKGRCLPAGYPLDIW